MTKTSNIKVEDLFLKTKQVLAAFHEERQKLEHERELLQMQLDEVTDNITANLAKLDAAELNERLELNLSNKGLNDKAEVITKMLEETEEAMNMTHLKFSDLLLDAKRTEAPILQKYNATDIVEKYKQAMLEEINGIAKQVKVQYLEVASDLHEIFAHPTVRYHHPRYSQMVNFDNYAPSFSAINNRVLSRSEVDEARYGGDL